MFEQVVCAATNLPCVIENAKAAYVQTTVCFIGRCLPGLPYLAVKLFAARVSAHKLQASTNGEQLDTAIRFFL
jgi:hypothetical protein